MAAVERLIRLKNEGLPIANSMAQLEVMIPYFRHPEQMRVAVQAHNAHEGGLLCAALTNVQIQSNGDVTTCISLPPVGNIKDGPIRRIWENRPRVWRTGCCLEWRLTPQEKEALSLPVLS